MAARSSQREGNPNPNDGPGNKKARRWIKLFQWTVGSRHYLF
jgi:hypothetical protein